MIAYISVLVALIGAVVYLVVANAKASEMGKLAYFAGLLAFLLTVADHTVKMLGK